MSAEKSGADGKIAADKTKGRKPGRRRREDEVIAAAVKVFHEHGYADASVQHVADELGILKGSLYHYIKTKEDLLYRVLVELHDQVERILEEVASVEGLLPLERLELYVRRQMQFNLENLPRVSVYYNDVERLSEKRHKDIIARRKVHERFVAELIEEAQERGEADASLDAQVLTNLIFGSVIWTYKWYRPNGKVSREKLTEIMVAFVLRGVVGESGSRPSGKRKAKAKRPRATAA